MYYGNLCHTLRNIIVTGNGIIHAQPTFAQVQIAVVTQQRDASEAQQENAVIMHQVIQSLLALNINREDIQTTAYTISPMYDYVDNKQIFKGYEVTNEIAVKIKDIQQTGEVIDTAVKSGANRVSTIQFKIENEDIYYQHALSLALHNAQLKARTIAETLKLPIHAQPIEIIEEGPNIPVPYQAFTKTSLATTTTPIESGQITISATVRVKYAY